MPKIVSPEEWLTARKELLAKEVELTRAKEAVDAQRRRLPMVEIVKDYVFEGPDGKASLLDLFEGRRVLIVHHVMWLDEHRRACPNCTQQMHDLGHLPHLHDQDITLAAVSRGPIDEIEAYREQQGWTFPWYSSRGSDFNYDFHVTLDDEVAPVLIDFHTREEYARVGAGPWDSTVSGDLPAVSVFAREGDRVFHTYSAFASGVERLIFTLNYLSLTPFGPDKSVDLIDQESGGWTKTAP